MNPPAVILAGGKSSRMGGGRKCLLPIRGKPMLAHIIAALKMQSRDILLNANGDTASLAAFGLRIAPDTIGGAQGPLAGLLAGMLWSRAAHPDAPWLLSVPSDTPNLPHDLVALLSDALTRQKADLAIACCAEGPHPTIGLWPVDLAARLERDLMETSIRSVQQWAGQFRVARAHFDTRALTNLNTPEDLTNLAWQRALPSGPAVSRLDRFES